MTLYILWSVLLVNEALVSRENHWKTL